MIGLLAMIETRGSGSPGVSTARRRGVLDSDLDSDGQSRPARGRAGAPDPRKGSRRFAGALHEPFEWMRSDSNFATMAPVGSCQSVVDAGALGSHAESGQRVLLRGQVLFVSHTRRGR